MCRLFLVILISHIFSFQFFAQLLKVGVFNDLNTKAVVFSAVNGSYLLSGDGRALESIKQGQNLYIALEGDSIRCMGMQKNYGTFKDLHFNAMIDSAIFSLRPIDPKVNIRFYDDNLEVYKQLGKLQTINLIDIDKYISGVVEAEGGNKASSEYYKSQAVLCRTYALNHLDRHTEENFNLCDGTHCQAYNGRNSGNPIILKASFETRKLVVVDTDTVFITAAFHSDCGGETESSNNVWLINKPYLKKVQDPYCQNQKNFRWEQKLSLETWKQYLLKNNFNLSNNMPVFFNFTQYKRHQYYRLGKDSITFRKIRNDFNFHSAFFSIEVKGDSVLFHGRGYGHGIGLCQEGAMQMAKLGYNFREIIQFYYQGVNIAEFNNVPVNKNPTLKLLEK